MDWLIYAGGGGLALAVILAVVVFRAIARPYTVLRERLEGLAAGDLASHTPYLDRRHSVGRMARALETCRQQRITEDEARRVGEDERRMVMSSLAEGLSALALARRGVAPAAMPKAVRAEPVLVVDNSPPPPPADDFEIRDLLTRLGQDRRSAIR